MEPMLWFVIFLALHYLLFWGWHYWRWHSPACWWRYSSTPQRLIYPSGGPPSERTASPPQSTSSGSRGHLPLSSPVGHRGTRLWWVGGCHPPDNSVWPGCPSLGSHLGGVPEFLGRHLDQSARHLEWRQKIMHDKYDETKYRVLSHLPEQNFVHK